MSHLRPDQSGCVMLRYHSRPLPRRLSSMMLCMFALSLTLLIAAHHPIHHAHHTHHHHHTTHFHHFVSSLRHHLLHSLVHSLVLLDEFGNNCSDCIDFLVGRRAIHFGDKFVQLRLLIFPFGHHISHVHSHHAHILAHHSRTAVFLLFRLISWLRLIGVFG